MISTNNNLGASVVVNAPLAIQGKITLSPSSVAAGVSMTALFGTTGASIPATTKLSWDFGDGTGIIVGGISQAHVYAKPGTYTVKASAVDAYGTPFVIQSATMTVTPPVLVSSITATPATGTAPLTVQFSLGAGSSIDATKGVQWDFGDGVQQSTTTTTTSHTYTKVGTYTVKAVVYDVYGVSYTLSGTASMGAIVNDAAPLLAFAAIAAAGLYLISRLGKQ